MRDSRRREERPKLTRKDSVILRNKPQEKALASLSFEIAYSLNEQSAQGKLAYLQEGQPRHLGPISPRLANTILDVYQGPVTFTVSLTNVSPFLMPSFSQINFQLFRKAVPNVKLHTAKEKLLDELEKHGIDVSSLRKENKKVTIHQEGVDTGIIVHSTENALTFYPGWTLYCGWSGWLVHVFDGNYHVVLKKKTCTALLNGQFQGAAGTGSAYQLSPEALDLIHELIHIHIAETNSLPAGVDEENIVSDIENLIFWRVTEDKLRKAGKNKAADNAKSEGDNLSQKISKEGASKAIEGLVK